MPKPRTAGFASSYAWLGVGVAGWGRRLGAVGGYLTPLGTHLLVESCLVACLMVGGIEGIGFEGMAEGLVGIGRRGGTMGREVGGGPRRVWDGGRERDVSNNYPPSNIHILSLIFALLSMTHLLRPSLRATPSSIYPRRYLGQMRASVFMLDAMKIWRGVFSTINIGYYTLQVLLGGIFETTYTHLACGWVAATATYKHETTIQHYTSEPPHLSSAEKRYRLGKNTGGFGRGHMNKEAHIFTVGVQQSLVRIRGDERHRHVTRKRIVQSTLCDLPYDFVDSTPQPQGFARNVILSFDINLVS
ncbi:hypothetical protein DM02DRAFT_635560 [Periconia macrospinosa]|uniref:Uncharacterized protein n=1 Tax=Periconia macrospinosa TaxID=97972 RepID=A0A2V1D3K1_9PLEO|nr:hypothetical protein DM02DRAFT_635560 [Periconia macrospinosa]